LKIPPKVELSREVKPDSELVLHAGSDLSFSVSVSGFPQARFDSMLNEQPLRYSASIDNFDESNIRIRIASIQKEHAGQISLKASNECGEDVKKFSLRVIDVPPVPRSIEAEIISSNSVEISWEPSKDDPNAPVDYYVVERKTAEHSRW
jgi:hypothetical protein